MGVYRFWRDSGYAIGGLIAGVTGDALGYGGAITIVAALTAASGLWVLGDMPSRHPAHGEAHEPHVLQPGETTAAQATARETVISTRP